MKRRKLHKQFSREAALLCACLLAAVLLWRSPTYLEAQSIRKAPTKKEGTEKTNIVPESAEAKPAPAPSEPAKAEAKPSAEEAKPSDSKPDAPAKDGEKDGDGADKDKSKAKEKDKDGKPKAEEKLLPTDEIQLSFQ